jgi:hypothetical protein
MLGQEKDQLAAKLGLAFQFGTHVNRIGLMYQVSYYNNLTCLTQSGYLHFNVKNLGPNKKGFEIQLQAAARVLWGEHISDPMYQFNELSVIAPYKNSAGYAFKYYIDQVRTTQATGALMLQFGRFEAMAENDFFSLLTNDDKFRTGAIMLAYRFDSLKVTLQSTQWTGNGSQGYHKKTKDYPSRFGYRDLRKALYGRLSHGILAIRADYVAGWQQSIRLESGIDAEQIRHFLQNRLVHDIMMPANLINHENAHYPMLTKDGSPFLFKRNQKIRPAKPYLHIGLNQPAFY